MISLHDQMGKTVRLTEVPKRIICLVPSITELLIFLDLESSMVGRTKFCVFPKRIRQSIPNVGGTKQVDFKKIEELNPDLIICNKEENTEEIVSYLESKFNIYISNIQTIHSALEMISDVGILTGQQEKANALIDSIESKRIEWHQNELPKRTALYLIWKKPYMTIGVDTFIFNMMQEMNFESVLYDFRYPEVTIDQIKKLKPEFILLSSEPFPFKEKEIAFFEKELPDCKVILVDGTYFSWYGNRILPAYDYFEMLHASLL